MKASCSIGFVTVFQAYIKGDDLKIDPTRVHLHIFGLGSGKRLHTIDTLSTFTSLPTGSGIFFQALTTPIRAVVTRQYKLLAENWFHISHSQITRVVSHDLQFNNPHHDPYTLIIVHTTNCPLFRYTRA